MYVSDDDLHLLEARPEMAYISPFMRFMWRYFSRPGAMASITYQGDYPARIRELFLTTTAVLHAHGARMILGTDTDNPYLVPGFSLLDELDYLIEAGLSPYAALETGTRNAAEAMGKLDEFGTVTVGKACRLAAVGGESTFRSTKCSQPGRGYGTWPVATKRRTTGHVGRAGASYRPSLIERILPMILLVLTVYVMRRFW